VLERMSGPLCEAVLELPGSGAMLAELARSNLLLVPLDHRGQWYRYHHLFRDMLLAELERLEPALVPVLRRRAAAWCSGNDLPGEALEYSMAAGDVDSAVQLVRKLWRPAYAQGRITTLQRWIGWLDARGGIEKHPLTAVFASFTAGAAGQAAEAERWADVVDRWQYQHAARPADPYTEAWAAVTRALRCRRGVEQMRADADEAARKAAVAGIAAPTIPLLQGTARILSGDLDDGDAIFEQGTAGHRCRRTQSSRAATLRAVAGSDGTQPVEPGRDLRQPSTRGAASGREGGRFRLRGDQFLARCGCGTCGPTRSLTWPCRPGSSSSGSIWRWPTRPGPGR